MIHFLLSTLSFLVMLILGTLNNLTKDDQHGHHGVQFARAGMIGNFVTKP